MMKKFRYNATCNTEAEKYDLLAIARAVNPEIRPEPSGYGDGYYIVIECTPDEYSEIARRWLKVV